MDFTGRNQNVGGLHSFWGEAFPLPFSAFGGSCTCWLLTLSLHHYSHLLPPSHLLPLTDFLFSCLSQPLGLQGSGIILENLPISRWLQLITSTNSLLPHEVSYSQVPWLRCRYLWKEALLAYHILLVRRACDYLKALETVPGTKHPQMWFVALSAFPTWSKAWP